MFKYMFGGKIDSIFLIVKDGIYMEEELLEKIESNEHVNNEVKEKLVEALSKVEDPELGIDIVNLGLVYRLDMDKDGNTTVIMTLTAMGCPLAGTIVTMVKEAFRNVEEVKEVEVDIVWNPPWSKERVSRMGRMALRIG
jgi:metal-sulfur cluster biosynthetic enzyme